MRFNFPCYCSLSDNVCGINSMVLQVPPILRKNYCLTNTRLMQGHTWNMSFPNWSRAIRVSVTPYSSQYRLGYWSSPGFRCPYSIAPAELINQTASSAHTSGRIICIAWTRKKPPLLLNSPRLYGQYKKAPGRKYRVLVGEASRQRRLSSL